MTNETTGSRLFLVSGGARSGKSRFAQQLALSLGNRRLFVATAQAWDKEMRDRIAAHQKERGPHFSLIEEPVRIDKALNAQLSYEVILIDCSTLWLSNLVMTGADDASIVETVRYGLEVAQEKAKNVIVVSNEVGLGIVPENALARRFRDLNGYLQQNLAENAFGVYFAIMGQILPLHRLHTTEGPLR